jgi:AcrR family transcriptional regulator
MNVFTDLQDDMSAGPEFEPASGQPNPLGRPRDPRIEGAVLDAARELLLEVGYGRLSFDQLARRAGVTRPTIYRRWPSKAHLVHEAIFTREAKGIGRDSGDFERDLRRFIKRTVAAHTLPVTRAALPGLLADFADHPGLREIVIERVWTATRKDFAEHVALAIGRGQLRPGVDSDRLLETITGAVFQHVVLFKQPVAGFAEFLTELVLHGLTPSSGQPTVKRKKRKRSD